MVRQNRTRAGESGDVKSEMMPRTEPRATLEAIRW